ncbi:hypothetical protein A1Q2_07521 [Trichosporon asahii var. asahii CBS 8904]|uniref:Small ribosomal subunit protein mS23 n=1 Tax=Trichosporon asahii var. asahii (strain CBS 8904) TaxID=1220162 RepID=K1V2T6_TRIAC|nr:hypothetical protein A1Q2_07521 [Trichosporon asahii var. asahii CBS 8904]
MVRKIPTQVPQQMSRMLESKLVQQPPTWWGAVLANPPPVLPPRQVTPRNRPDATLKQYPDLEEAHFAQHHGRPHSKNHKQKHLKEIKPKPVQISYAIDKIRRQFFADFPFEALRPTSISEGIDIADENPVQGKNWTKLVQRGRYPTVEDTIQFAQKLHAEDGMALQLAYDEAVSQFCQLRAHHEMASQAAETEARHYGAHFKRDESDLQTRTFDKERSALARTAIEQSDDPNAAAGNTGLKWIRKPKVWASDVPAGTIPVGEFTGAKTYVAKWSLPAPARWAGANTEEPKGELLKLLGRKARAPPPPKADGEMDDAQLLAAITGKQ